MITDKEPQGPSTAENCWTVPATLLVLLGCLLVFALGAADEAQPVDPGFKPYVKVKHVSGTLTSVGSDTMQNLVTLWADGFRRHYPKLQLMVEAKGSGTAPPALTEGTAQLAPMSRKMYPGEIEQFKRKFGYQPTAFPVAMDTLAVYVNKDNPLKGLTIEQVDAIFSKTRRQGSRDDIREWGQLGLTGEWQGRPIMLYSRNIDSGTYGFFKDHALGGGDFKDEIKQLPGSPSVVQGIAHDRYGIGYSGIGYASPGVRAVPLAQQSGMPYEDATVENAKAGGYPLWRYLYIYVNHAPGKPLPLIVREFLRYVYSRDGQRAVVEDGYFSLDENVARQSLLAMNERR